MKKFSFFEIEESRKKQIIKALNGKQVGGTKLSIEVAKDKPKEDSTSKQGKASRPKGRGYKTRGNDHSGIGKQRSRKSPSSRKRKKSK